MTRGVHNYTNPFRKDGPFMRCEMCGKPATHVIVMKHALDPYRVCDDHRPNPGEEVSDVRPVPGDQGEVH